MPRVLVVVLSYNKKDLVLECLASLERHGPERGHVVVFDNASADGSQAALRAAHPDVELVCSDTNLGAIGGRNAAVAHARDKVDFDYVLFLDDDAEVADGAIDRLVLALEREPGAGIACGKTYVRLDSDVLMSAGIECRLAAGLCYDRGAGERDTGQFDRGGEVAACGAFAFLIRARVFDELGGFDDAFAPYGWEDVDLCLRARSAGHRTLYVPEAVFAHKGTRLGRAPIPRYERSKARNFLTLLRRHATPLEQLSAAVLLPLRALLLFGRFALGGNWRAITAQLRGGVDFARTRLAKRPPD